MECVKYQPKHISESSVATTFMTFLLTSERTNNLLPQNQKARPKPVGRAEVESVESCENKYLYNTNNLYCIYFWQHDILSVHGFLLTSGKERVRWQSFYGCNLFIIIPILAYPFLEETKSKIEG